MSYQHYITNGTVTTVDCHKQVRSWRLLRYLIALLIPTCHSSSNQKEDDVTSRDPTNCLHRTTSVFSGVPGFREDHQQPTKTHHRPCHLSSSSSYPCPTPCTTRAIGTIFGFRRGSKVSLCIQTISSSSNSLLLLLELPMPTSFLARDMQGGALRIALESSTTSFNTTSFNNYNNNKVHPSGCLLSSTPLWATYCNGRKVGYAARKTPSKGDVEALRLMGSVIVGAGIISGKEVYKEDDELIYFRAKFERVCGSSDAESFHLIDPDGSIGQELSIFFFRK